MGSNPIRPIIELYLLYLNSVACTNKQAYNSYMKDYMLKRYNKRIAQAKAQLGGKCVQCGSIEDLQFDHINPSDKEFVIGRLWNLNESKFQSELAKCQLLCKECHIKKTAIDVNRPLARGTHGTLSSYRYCKCDQCKEAKRQYTKEYKRKLKNSGP